MTEDDRNRKRRRKKKPPEKKRRKRKKKKRKKRPPKGKKKKKRKKRPPKGKKKKKRKKKPPKKKRKKKKPPRREKPNQKRKNKNKTGILDSIKYYMFPTEDYYDNPEEDFSEWLSMGDHEELMWWGQPTYWLLFTEGLAVIGAFLLSIIVSIVGVYFTGLWYIGLIPLGVGIMGAIWWLEEWVWIRYRFYAITDYKIVEKRGIPFLSMKTEKVHYKDVSNPITTRDTLEEWAHRLGIVSVADIDIIVEGDNDDQANILMKYITDSDEVMDIIVNQRQQTLSGMNYDDQVRAFEEALDEEDEEPPQEDYSKEREEW